MPIQVVIASLAVASGVVLLVWSVSSVRLSTRSVARNLTGERRITDMRELQLERSAIQRALRPALARLARRARRLTPIGWIEKLESRILLAGVSNQWPVERVLAGKLFLAVAGGLIGALVLWTTGLPGPALVVAGVLAAIGYFIPDLALTSKGQERQKAIQLALPDTLDQVTISVEAGLGFEAALERSARSNPGPLSEEIIRSLQEIKLGHSRKEAFKALADRTDVAELRRFVFAIIQAEDYGMPIATVLRVQASEQRVQRRQRAEEQAMKIPVKILFPLVLCIFPVMFIVLVGPAAIQLARTIFGIDI